VIIRQDVRASLFEAALNTRCMIMETVLELAT
jgi:hypothetical protein